MCVRLVLVNFVLFIIHVAFCSNIKIQKSNVPENNPSTFSTYAFDNRKAQSLALLEEKFYDTLSRDQDQFKSVPPCHSQISKYLRDFERDVSSLDHASGETKGINLVQNPLLMFRQLRRIYQTLLHDVAKHCEVHAKIKDKMEKLFNTYQIPMVIQRDLEDALRSILRLHYIYGFNAFEDLRKGIIGGVDTGVLLSVEDCAALAKAALDIYEAQILAYQWLIAAEEIQNEEGLDADEDTMSKLADVWTRLENLTDVNTKQDVKQKFNGKLQKSLNGKEGFDDYEYYATCRGESFLTQEELSQRFCYYEATYHPYLLLNPAKIEFLSFDPVILQIHDILNPSAKSYVERNLRETLMPTSLVILKHGKPERSPESRMATQIPNRKEHPEIERMILKEEVLTGFITRKSSKGQFNAAIYNPFCYLSFHYDILPDTYEAYEATSYGNKKDYEDRILTMTYYLTDVELGGATAFPEVGVWATPVANSALFWLNLKEDGHPDTRMMHGGCPVLLGSKKIATRWIYQNDNIFKKPCPLHAAPEVKQ